MRFLFLLSIVIGLAACSLPSPSSIGTVQQFQKDTAAIRKYIQQNNILATELPSGVWFIVDSASIGIRPTFNDVVTVSSKTRLMTDNSLVDQSSAFSEALSNKLSGIQIALPQFPSGSKGRIFIPSYYGYQDRVNGSIPANSNLIIEFKLKEVSDPQISLDTASIGSYLRSQSISFNTDPQGSGLIYKVDTVGTGAVPLLIDSVVVKYKSTLFSTGSVVDQKTAPVKFALSTLILGWQIGLPLIPEGGTITLYIPSSLAYGPTSNSGIPAKSILVCTVQLKKVIHH
jgi:FKBP-type peptidyl-prolyl cis-trans isomerase FkpA